MRYQLGAVVLVLALVPLVAATTLVFIEARQARIEKGEVESAADDVTRLVQLTDLRISLLEERNWRIASVWVGFFPSNAAATEAIESIDVEQELATATDRVDYLIDALGLTAELEDRLIDARTGDAGSIFAIGGEYREIELTLANQSDLVMNRLMDSAGNLQNGGRLISALRVLETTTTARQAISAEIHLFLAVGVFGPYGIADAYDELVLERSIRIRALTDIDRIGSAGSSVSTTLALIDDSADIDAYEAAIDRLLEPSTDQSAGFDLTRVDELLSITTTATNLYLELVNSAGVDALNASASMQFEVVRRDQRALGLLSLLIVCTTWLAWFAYRSLLAPIAGLSLRAQQIRDGDTEADPAPLTGPIEVRQATSAINEAAEQLKLAELQATALAAGDLQHESLGQPIHGELGASLQKAVRTLASSLAEREDFRQRMRYEATHDGLTQLSNRRAALTRLEQGLARTERTGTRLAVLLFNLDWFKEINDHRGHPVGDMVLQIVARRLTGGVRPGDHVGRLGGDEFVVIAEPVDGDEEALGLAERIRQVLTQPMEIDGDMLAIGVSVGIALSSGNAADAADLLHDADLAVDLVKRHGKGGVEFCTDELRASVAAKANFEQAIRQAIADDEFVLHYQPLIAAATGRCVGVESLIRWERPGVGVEQPGAFIPHAEESDLIIEIDNWVLRAAAEQLVKWEAARINEGLTVGVNISGRHLNSPSFVQDVLRPFREYGIDPRRLVVEITEGSLLDDLPSAAGKLTVLRSHGVRVAIDDFGTGFTSLAHLRSLPIDVLKIDRSFTRDDSSASLLKLIVDIGHLLDVEVVAEGIETANQAEMLSSIGADVLQGFLYGRPEPASESIWLGLGGDRRAVTGVKHADRESTVRTAASPGRPGE